MISSSVRNKEFGNQNHKEKLLGKILERYKNEDQNQSQRLSFTLNFLTLFKTNKDQIFKLKNSFENLY